MTDSDTLPRPPDAPPPGPEWKIVPGFTHYEWSHRGRVRSVDRTLGGRTYRGQELKPRPNNSGYLIVNVVDDNAAKRTVLLHRMILVAHGGAPGPGQESLHGPGGQLDNRYPENLRWGTKPENEADKAAGRPAPAPKPPAPCLNHERCGGYVSRGGRRCHECVVTLGRAGAALLEEGADLEKAADFLGYASAAGLFKLAVKYGGLRVYIDDQAPGHAEQPPSWLRRVMTRVKAWLADSDTP